MWAQIGMAKADRDKEDFATLQGLRVLLAEDQILVALYFEELLTDLGCAVLGPVGTVAAALRVAECQPLDGAILDIRMRSEDSFPVARALKARPVPFFFITGHSEAMLPDDLQGVPCLIKPVSTQAFAFLVRELFAKTA